MLDSPPRESETVSWTYVVIGVAVIYATIPVARALRENLHTHLGLEYFLYLTLAGVILLAYVGLRNAGRRKLAASAKWTPGLIAARPRLRRMHGRAICFDYALPGRRG